MMVSGRYLSVNFGPIEPEYVAEGTVSEVLVFFDRTQLPSPFFPLPRQLITFHVP